MINRADDDVMWELAWAFVGLLLGTALAATTCEEWWSACLVALFGVLFGVRVGRALEFTPWERIRNSGDHIFWIAAYTFLGGFLSHWAAVRFSLPLEARAASTFVGIAAGAELGRFVAFSRWRRS